MLIQRPDRVQHAFGVPCLDLGLGTGLADALDGAEQHVVRDARGALARLSVSSRSTSASPSGQEDRLAIHSCNTVLRRREISGLQLFLYVQAPMLAWPSNCSDHRALCPYSPKAVYTVQYLHRYRPQAPASLRVRIRIPPPRREHDRTCERSRTHSPAGSQPCRLLLTPATLRRHSTPAAKLEAVRHARRPQSTPSFPRPDRRIDMER